MTKQLFFRILLFFFLWLFLRYAFLYLAALFIPLDSTFTITKNFRGDFPYFVWAWANFDGYHYLHIAQQGYGLFQNPFMPFYPLGIRFVHNIFELPYLVSAQIISNVAFFLSLLLIVKLGILDKVNRLFTLLALVIILFPTSYSYGAVYNDSLFFLLALLTIYFSRKKIWPAGGIFGGFATLTRVNGLALFPLVILEYLSGKKEAGKTWDLKFSVSKIRVSKIYFSLLIPLSFIAYLIYTHLVYGNWQLFFSSLKLWEQSKVTFPLQVLWRYFKIIVLYPTFKLNWWVAIIEVLFVFFYVAFLIFSYKKIRISYWTFFFFSLLIPWLSGSFQGMPRYGLHLYPLFLSIAMFLEERRLFLKLIYYLVSVVFLFICLAFFTRGYFIA